MFPFEIFLIPSFSVLSKKLLLACLDFSCECCQGQNGVAWVNPNKINKLSQEVMRGDPCLTLSDKSLTIVTITKDYQNPTLHKGHNDLTQKNTSAQQLPLQAWIY
jgi:hypothetical protein